MTPEITTRTLPIIMQMNDEESFINYICSKVDITETIIAHSGIQALKLPTNEAMQCGVWVDKLLNSNPLNDNTEYKTVYMVCLFLRSC